MVREDRKALRATAACTCPQSYTGGMAGSPGDLVLIGGGGHALVVAESARRAGLDVCGFVDDAADAPLGCGPCSLERLGPITALRERAAVRWHLAIGSVQIRRALLETLWSERASAIVDASAVVADSAEVGAGAFVSARAVVQSRAHVGPHCIVNTAAVIEHECVLAENVHVAPGAVLGGRVRVGRDTLIGLGARVLPGVRIGERCVIGAGSVVIGDVPEGARVVGVPARAV